MEILRLIDVNDLGRYAVTIEGHKYIPWVSLAEVPTACSNPAKLDRSRWEGCDCCTAGDSEFRYLLDKWGEDDYCHRCGRPLTEEAWTELERRIGGNDETD